MVSSSRSKIVPSVLLWIIGSLVAIALAIIVGFPQPELDWDGTILPKAKRYMEHGGGGKISSSSQPLNGLVVAVTGATSGIGLGLTRKLSLLGATVIAIGRSSTKLETLFHDDSNVRTVVANLNDLDSIANASEYILKEYNHLDILVNNAGIHTGLSGLWDYSTTTKQGYDLTFGVNYLSHFLLTEKLMPLLSKNKKKKGRRKSKIIQVSSSFHWAVDGTDLAASSETQQQPIASVPGGSHGFVAYRTQRQYANSKLAQIYHARSIQKYNKDVIAVSTCPAWVGTQIIGAQSNSWISWIFSKIAYPSDGYGLHSILNAILDIEGGNEDDDDNKNFYVNNYSPLISFISDSLPSPWTYSILPIRDILVQQFINGLMFTQRLFPSGNTNFKQKSSKASYDERIQEELYQWSRKAVSKWL